MRDTVQCEKRCMNICKKLPSRMEVVPPFISEVIKQLERENPVTEEEEFHIKLVLEEALTNAIKHGNKFGTELSVDTTIRLQQDRLMIIVKDQGGGFDFNHVADPTAKERLLKTSGRGVFLIKKLMDEVSFHDGGREIRIVKKLNQNQNRDGKAQQAKEDKMKKIAVLLIGFVMLWASGGFAQQVQIIDIQGKVLVKKDAESKWEKAEVKMWLGRESEIKTKGNAICTVAFDTKRKNIITIKDKSIVKIESIIPGNVFLSKGRVFALIDNIEASGKFEVRTPTAIAGARGTGWLTEYIGGETSVSCFDDIVEIASLDSEGNVLDEMPLAKGLEIEVTKDLDESAAREISPEEQGDWQEFVSGIAEAIEEMGPTGPGPEDMEHMREMMQQEGLTPEQIEKMMQHAPGEYSLEEMRQRMEQEGFTPEQMDQMRQMMEHPPGEYPTGEYQEPTMDGSYSEPMMDPTMDTTMEDPMFTDTTMDPTMDPYYYDPATSELYQQQMESQQLIQHQEATTDCALTNTCPPPPCDPNINPC